MQVVGISLVRNEDRFVSWALRNTIDFCDRLLVLDNNSTDDTMECLLRLKSIYPKIEIHSIDDPSESHAYVEPFAGSESWVLGIDGDEIYDPEGLLRLKQRLLAGEFRASWGVHGNVLNCVKLDATFVAAEGYLAPPCRSMTKLYNFSAISSWTNCTQRLHGGILKYKPDFPVRLPTSLYETISWEKADLRCLHLCFLARSSLEGSTSQYARRNISELNRMTAIGKIIRRWCPWVSRYESSKWKMAKYRRGKCVRKSIVPFLKGGQIEEDLHGNARYISDQNRS